MPDNPPIIAGTRIGHVHLKVSDLDRGEMPSSHARAIAQTSITAVAPAPIRTPQTT